MTEFYRSVQSYLVVYQKSATYAWNNMTPQQYASILIFVAFGGWIMMRSNLK